MHNLQARSGPPKCFVQPLEQIKMTENWLEYSHFVIEIIYRPTKLSISIGLLLIFVSNSSSLQHFIKANLIWIADLYNIYYRTLDFEIAVLE